MRRGRRPNRSMVQNETGVEQTLTRVVISEMRKGLPIVPRADWIDQYFRALLQLLVETHEEDCSKVEDEVDT